MGCLVWPTSPTNEDNMAAKPSTNGTRTVTKSPDDACKTKPVKNQKKPPRFMKLEGVESKTDKSQRNGTSEEDYTEPAAEQSQPPPPPQPPLPQQQIPVAIPYTPQYTVQYPAPYSMPSYPIQPVQEPLPVDAAPIATVSYADHPPHYLEPPYTIPYMVYTHPQYYYSN